MSTSAMRQDDLSSPSAADPLFDSLCLQAEQILESSESSAQKAHLLTFHSLFARQVYLTQQIIVVQGRAVQAGPFKGMKLFPNGSMTGGCLPRLMGNYEYELHTALDEIATKSYQTVINLGSAEGYYTVGLARLLPQAKVYAAEIQPQMQQLTLLAAQDNYVANRITVTDGLSASNINTLIRGRTLVFCDIEGAELDLLDPALAPNLAQADMLVELHELYRPGLIETLKARFAATHTYQQIEPGDGAPILPDITRTWSDINRTLLTFEGRSGYTPWGWWQSKAN